MFPAFAHFRRTATRDVELNGKQIREGDKVVMWYVSSNRDETRYEDPDTFEATRDPDHQAFGAGGRHFCLGAALARLELKILFEETLARYPEMEVAGEPEFVESAVRQPAEDAAGPAGPARRLDEQRPETRKCALAGGPVTPRLLVDRALKTCGGPVEAAQHDALRHSFHCPSSTCTRRSGPAVRSACGRRRAAVRWSLGEWS